MEPVLQHLGDVTIQRVEKPKNKGAELRCDTKNEKNEPIKEETPSIKRNYADDFELANKRAKIDNSNDEFSESEISDYETDSDFESDSELSSKIDKPPDASNDDYEYDIKEKLKEMGEISFEAIKKGDKPKKSEPSENEVVLTTKKSTEEDAMGERKGGNLRRNIREVMDETKLDESTLAAQRQEMERLRRVQEQQRMIRDVQRQVAQERVQNKVLSLLQGHPSPKPGPSGARIGNTVLVKLPNGQTKPMTKLTKRPFDFVRIQKYPPGTTVPTNSRSLINMIKSPNQLTPSVSIAPVEKKPTQRPFSDSESENEEKPMKFLPKPKPKEPQVPTIDLSSEDDDCIVISETEGEQSEEHSDDPANSGMHTNDEFNQPDEQGRVVVNIGHPDGEPDVYLAPQIARIIKPHQIGGVRFLYDNVVESINRFETSTGFGCILAHSMGLGKTLQVVCFSDVFLRHTPGKTILCIMPINTLQNWVAEYNMWLPTEENAPNSPLHIYGEVRARTFNLHVLNDSHKTLEARSKVIKEWKSGGGVLLIGYEQYRLLSTRKHPKSRRKTTLVEPPPENDKNKALFDEVHEALVLPGPDLVICDEGHRIKNSHASISLALKKMRTKRRVVLTGYPLQNNLMEYWCMVDFVRPNYLGTKTEFCNMFERPIQNGQCIDSTETDIKLMRYRAHVLHSLLVGFVQRRSHKVLHSALPQKEEYVLLIRMTTFQRKLYSTFMNDVVRSQTVPNPLKAFAVCCKIWNHPDVLYNFLKKRAGGEAVDIDLEEVSGTVKGETKPKRGAKRVTAPKGKRTGKPAASVTPYSSSGDSGVNSNSENSLNVTQIKTEIKSEFPVPYNSNPPFQQPYYNPVPNDSEKGVPFSQNRNVQNFSQPNFTQNFTSKQNFQNFPQNFWNGAQNPNYQSNELFNNFRSFNQNSNTEGSFNNPNWIKKEDVKPIITNNIITNPMKTGTSSSETKPKINIISDIRIGGNNFGNFPMPDKKFNPSHIKLEVKKEEWDEKPEIKPEIKSEDDEVKIVNDNGPLKMPIVKEDTGIPYDWAIELLKDYVPGCIENSAKMEVLFCIIEESIALGDRLLLFSQSLITLDLIEQFLQMNAVPGETQHWAKNTNYYRLDGSTSALEREKLINEFNSNSKIHLFLVSTRAGSLGINLVGANRVVVLDASWNPCHDTQAVCRVYRYGQRKPCFVYRLVMDHCLEKKIYDRQVNKQGMSDRVVDECNPDAHLTMKDVSTLCFDEVEEAAEKDWSHVTSNYIDVVLQKVLERYGTRFNKEPFHHESLLVDRKEKQLSVQEKRLAKKGYEKEKQAARQPSYGAASNVRGHRPVASVRPMQQGIERVSRWIPAEQWQRQGMTAQEMTLPLDVVIPTNHPEKSNIVLKAGQKVLVLKSPKGVYMQLENGKIVAIKTAIKVRGKAEDNDNSKILKPALPPIVKNNLTLPHLGPKRMIRPFAPGMAKLNIKSVRQAIPNLVPRMQGMTKRIQIGKPKPYSDELGRIGELHGESELLALSSDEEHVKMERNDFKDFLFSQHSNYMQGLDKIKCEVPESAEIRPIKESSLLKNFRRSFPLQKTRENSTSSALQQLEQSTSAIISDSKQPFQETLNNITNTYSNEEELQDDSENPVLINQQSSSSSDYQASPSNSQQYYQPTTPHSASNESSVQSEGGTQPIKTDIPPAEYNYNNYYGYNHMQTYPAHPPPQGYSTYPPQPPPYDVMGYSQPQQSQYGYGYPQTYSQPPPQYPPHNYEYGPPPPQPMYGSYPAPYPPPPQQYPPPAPPPPPPQVIYPSGQAAPPFPDYQYNSSTGSSYYPPA